MFGNYINGEWISTGATFENRNPATGEVVGTFVKGTAADIDAAAAAASAAFPGWSATSGPGRGNILYKAADILDKNFESVTGAMTREEGKTLPEAIFLRWERGLSRCSIHCASGRSLRERERATKRSRATGGF